MKSKAWNQLMKRLGWDLKAGLSTIKLRHVELHLPMHLFLSLNSASGPNTCTGCPECGGPE